MMSEKRGDRETRPRVSYNSTEGFGGFLLSTKPVLPLISSPLPPATTSSKAASQVKKDDRRKDLS
jgi:hypothetical protein